ncbi:MAG: hypothetical protein AB1921_17600 [Thermodesulfobacteriota bacterium]
MGEDNEKAQQEAVRDIFGLVVRLMKDGQDKPAIVRRLTDYGMEESAAREVVGAIYDKVAKQAEAERVTPASLVPAAVGGVAAALASGALWAVIAVVAKAEIGFVAIGVGYLAGLAVVRASGGRKGLPMQLIASLSSILGVAAGKYGTFYHYFKAFLVDKYGEEALAALQPWSGEVLGVFASALPDMLSGYDALWVILALATAWSIPKSSGIKAAPSLASTSLGPK